MAHKVTLHCPSIDKTKSEFTLGPFDKHDKVLQQVRTFFKIEYAAVYDIRAQPIDDICACEAGQIVQVAASKGEIMKYYKPKVCIFYNGEEEVSNEWVDGYGLPWKDLNDYQRCSHVMSLGKGPGGFVLDNTIRITRPYADVQKDLKEVAGAAPDGMESKRNLGIAIFLNWAWKWEMLLPVSMKPAKDSDMSSKVLGLLVVLSSFTHGSASLVRGYLVETVNARVSGAEDDETKDPLLRAQDVVHVISTLYEKAGSLAAKIALAKEKAMKDKMKEKARKTAWKAKQKTGGKGKEPSDVDDLADQLGGPQNYIDLT
ncbi:uncharacterized protein J4E92_007443 [Alternaria infectoria]|uniref:uncharacterized protein n=1 Tax=Alternaria infectoria TaxID=45303 RepID=UPI00222045AF|nr:uncharacterized protein J4E92_007443 [Alternaria infectoria]KAI4924362.1 hypothetical protein J4E92_007443 [Alternaria infectoria]